jgi:phospholipase/carboxylesterase
VIEETRSLGGLHTIAVGDPDAPVMVALLHGFQMEPADLSPFAHSMQAPARFLFPTGPLEAEPRGRAWWHIDAKQRDEALARGPRDFAGQHPPDLPRARARLSAFLDEARALAGTRPLVVGGFSQGAMLTLDCFLRAPVPAAALILLSGSRIAFDEWRGDALRGLPVLITHGESDPDLAFSAGEALRDWLVSAGAQVIWLPFSGGHEIPLVVWRRVRKLLLALAQQ